MPVTSNLTSKIEVADSLNLQLLDETVSDSAFNFTGGGYSIDRMTYASRSDCFNTTATLRTPVRPGGMERTDNGVDFEEMLDHLSVFVNKQMNNTLIGAGPLAWDPYSNYLRKINHSEGGLTFSINYFKFEYDIIDIKVNGNGEDSLTAKGKEIYDQNHT